VVVIKGVLVSSSSSSSSSRSGGCFTHTLITCVNGGCSGSSRSSGIE